MQNITQFCWIMQHKEYLLWIHPELIKIIVQTAYIGNVLTSRISPAWSSTQNCERESNLRFCPACKNFGTMCPTGTCCQGLNVESSPAKVNSSKSYHEGSRTFFSINPQLHFIHDEFQGNNTRDLRNLLHSLISLLKHSVMLNYSYRLWGLSKEVVKWISSL